MTKGSVRILGWLAGSLALALLLAGCGGSGGSGSTSSTGVAKISLTDAPATDLDHVWVTVREILFHKSELAEAPVDQTKPGSWEADGWLRYPLPKPVSIDLNHLSNGAYQTLWDGITLPAGLYTQIRLILAATEAPLTESAYLAGLHFNNQIDEFNDPNPYPLRIPAAQNGIKLIGNFQVTTVSTLHLVIDFDVSQDVVETGKGEYILKPRLKYYDMSNAGAITGKLLPPAGHTFTNFSGFDFIVKAEQPAKLYFETYSTQVRKVMRATSIKPDGSFTLFPLPVNEKPYDLVIRGRKTITTIVTQVQVTSDNTFDNPKVVPDITLEKGTEYLLQGSMTPKGGWVIFYQTLPTLSSWDSIPYAIRQRNANPYDGTFSLYLSAELLKVGEYNGADPILFSYVEPLEGAGSFTAIAEALLYWPAAKPVTPLTDNLIFSLKPIGQDIDDSTDGDTICDELGLKGSPSININNNRGTIFIIYGGTIIDSFNVDEAGQPTQAITLPAIADKEFHGSSSGGNTTTPTIKFKPGKGKGKNK